MSLKSFLILMTAVAVVSDSLLHPFYPQYFSSVFQVQDPQHVGFYIAACSFTVLVSFPLWAHLAKRFHVLHLLVVTQVVTGVLSLACYALTSLTQFWGVSLVMMVFKASYLLIYPYALSVEEKDQQLGTIGLLAFVVYFGNILAALLSGTVFELLNPRWLFAVMACGDLLQILLCLYMLRLPGVEEEIEATEPAPEAAAVPAPRHFVYRLGLVMFVLYFSAYVTDPFFSAYWEKVSTRDNKILSGLVFAIPGVAALLALYVNAKRKRKEEDSHVGVVPAIWVGIVGLLLEASGVMPAMLVGRFCYGWALFQCMVRMDVLLFRFSTPESYAVDFSKVNLFQGLGVLCASFAAGFLARSFEPRTVFFVAASGFGLGVLLFWTLLRKALNKESSPPLETETGLLSEGRAT